MKALSIAEGRKPVVFLEATELDSPLHATADPSEHGTCGLYSLIKEI